MTPLRVYSALWKAIDLPEQPNEVGMSIRITAAAILALALLSPPAEAAKRPPGGFDIQHCALSGDVVDQPAGSPITACCYEDGCWICDENWGNCTWDPAYSSVRPGGGAAIEQGPAVLAPAEPSRPTRPGLQRQQPGGRTLR